MLSTLKKISAAEFENLTYDLLVNSGLRRVVWRTPGADGGRDIEGIFSRPDFSGYLITEKWYVECKRYSHAIDWPTIYGKVAYAESNQADFLLLVTTANPTPNCENEIVKWNFRQTSVKIRIWRGYELSKHISSQPEVASKYGLIQNLSRAQAGLFPVMFEIMKLAQASYAAHSFKGNVQSYIEANAALSELALAKFEQIKNYGRADIKSPLVAVPDYEWLKWDGPFDVWDEPGLRAMIALARHITGATIINVTSNKIEARVKLENYVRHIDQNGEDLLIKIAMLANLEVCTVNANEFLMVSR